MAIAIIPVAAQEAQPPTQAEAAERRSMV